jgi:hypothetical protein
MLRITRRTALAAGLSTAMGLGVGSATASAATTISGLPTTAPIVNKLYVPLAMSISCDAPSFFFMSASATIRQVVARKEIAHGTASINGLICDGVPHAYTINVFPDTASGFPGGSSSAPFKQGDAVVTAQMSTDFDFVTAGPQPIRLTK